MDSAYKQIAKYQIFVPISSATFMIYVVVASTASCITASS